VLTRYPLFFAFMGDMPGGGFVLALGGFHATLAAVDAANRPLRSPFACGEGDSPFLRAAKARSWPQTRWEAGECPVKYGWNSAELEGLTCRAG
jgi:hypothetical protein